VADGEARAQGKGGLDPRRLHRVTLTAQLVRADAPNEKPVFHRHRRYFFVLRMSRHPYIEIEPSMLNTPRFADWCVPLICCTRASQSL